MNDENVRWLELHGFTKKENVRTAPGGVEWERRLNGKSCLSVVHEHDGNWCCVADTSMLIRCERGMSVRDACMAAVRVLAVQCRDIAGRCRIDGGTMNGFLEEVDGYGK